MSGAEVHTVPGMHERMLSEPNVRVLAAYFKAHWRTRESPRPARDHEHAPIRSAVCATFPKLPPNPRPRGAPPTGAAKGRPREPLRPV